MSCSRVKSHQKKRYEGSLKAHGSVPSRAQTARTTSSHRGQGLERVEHTRRRSRDQEWPQVAESEGGLWGAWFLTRGWVCFREGKKGLLWRGESSRAQGAGCRDA